MAKIITFDLGLTDQALQGDFDLLTESAFKKKYGKSKQEYRDSVRAEIDKALAARGQVALDAYRAANTGAVNDNQALHALLIDLMHWAEYNGHDVKCALDGVWFTYLRESDDKFFRTGRSQEGGNA